MITDSKQESQQATANKNSESYKETVCFKSVISVCSEIV